MIFPIVINNYKISAKYRVIAEILRNFALVRVNPE